MPRIFVMDLVMEELCGSEYVSYDTPLSRCLLPKFHEGWHFDLSNEVFWDHNGHQRFLGETDEEEL